MVGSTYVQDLVIVGTLALFTIFLRSKSQQYFQKNVPEWQKFNKNLQSRLAVEIAAIPTRILLIYFTLPIVLRGFKPIQSWHSDDTEACVRACAILTGTYIVDLTVTRNDKGSTLHHCMGPALLLWIRTCFATFTPSDALLCRLLMSFVFFGGTISGATTTTLVFLVQFRNIWFQSKTWSTVKDVYFYVAVGLPVLAFATIAGVFYCTSYLHYWFDEFVSYFGYWGYLPLGWVVLECGMQWKWLWRFYSFEAQNRAKFAEAPGDSLSEVVAFADQAWWLPSWRFRGLQLLIVTWGFMVFAMAWRHGDIHAVARTIQSATQSISHTYLDKYYKLGGAALSEL